ncbi:MAG: molecular chaperone TorD family protein [Chloroflexi bacterium]|nr:molecular chaperone TorD family protein [Chloroflexota bacterium]
MSVLSAPAAAVRAACYSLLAEAFGIPTPSLLRALTAQRNEGFWANVAELSPRPDLGKSVAHLQSEARATGRAPKALAQLTQEYSRLFSGPYHLEAPPYESIYVDGSGLVMGEASAKVKRLYAEAGLAVAPEWRDLPDHVAAEVAFMAHLCQGESVADSQPGRLRQSSAPLQYSFLKEHLGRWLPLLRRRVEATGLSPFYTALCWVAELFVLEHLEELRGQVGETSDG